MYGRLFRYNDQFPVIVLCVSEKTVVVDLDLALLIAELDAKSDVCRQGFRIHPDLLQQVMPWSEEVQNICK